MTKNEQRNKVLYVEITPDEHSVLKIESAVSSKSMGDIIREQLLAPLKAKHGALLGRSAKTIQG